MTWTKRKPNRVGWWWCKRRDFSIQPVKITRFDLTNPEVFDLYKSSWSSKPIPEPSYRKDKK